MDREHAELPDVQPSGEQSAAQAWALASESLRYWRALMGDEPEGDPPPTGQVIELRRPSAT
jgi:hypothetical protein